MILNCGFRQYEKRLCSSSILRNELSKPGFMVNLWKAVDRGERTMFFSRWLSLFNWIVNFALRFDILSDATFVRLYFFSFFIDIFPFSFVQNMNKIFILDISIKLTSVLEIIRVFLKSYSFSIEQIDSHKY